MIAAVVLGSRKGRQNIDPHQCAFRGILLLAQSVMVHADAFDDGLAAYQCSNYATALIFWKLLAEGAVSRRGFLGLIYYEYRSIRQDDNRQRTGIH